MTRRIIHRLAIASLAALPLLSACSAVGLGGKATQKPTPLVVDDEAFAKIGFRRDWTGFPIMSPGGTIREFFAGPDIIIV